MDIQQHNMVKEKLNKDGFHTATHPLIGKLHIWGDKVLIKQDQDFSKGKTVDGLWIANNTEDYGHRKTEGTVIDVSWERRKRNASHIKPGDRVHAMRTTGMHIEIMGEDFVLFPTVDDIYRKF